MKKNNKKILIIILALIIFATVIITITVNKDKVKNGDTNVDIEGQAQQENVYAQQGEKVQEQAEKLEDTGIVYGHLVSLE